MAMCTLVVAPSSISTFDGLIFPYKLNLLTHAKLTVGAVTFTQSRFRGCLLGGALSSALLSEKPIIVMYGVYCMMQHSMHLLQLGDSIQNNSFARFQTYAETA